MAALASINLLPGSAFGGVAMQPAAELVNPGALFENLADLGSRGHSVIPREQAATARADQACDLTP